MKKTFLSFLIVNALATGIFFSCKKERSCEGCINGNRPPTAVAGPDQVITLPTDSISLDGSPSSDTDGTISEWLWTKIEGPGSFNIVNPTAAKSVAKNLDTGTYRFELKVTDNGGLSAKDTIQIIVNGALQPNRPPIAVAGADQTITLSVNSVNLDGSSSTDPDNNIAGYAWTKISGPSTFNIANANVVQTQVTNLVEGVYQFELKVTDGGGLFSKDTVLINVNQIVTATCEPLNRPIINAQLIPVGNLSIGRYGTAAVSAGNKIFFAGGISGPGTLSSCVDIYDITSQTWTTAELSIPRHYISAVAAGDKVFFAGGFSTGATSRVDIYNLATQTWAIAELSQPRAYIETATVGNKVFFAGGSDGISNSSRVDIYDITADEWSTDYLSEARIGFTATAADNKIYFAGGEQSGVGSASKKIDIYNNATDSWSSSVLNAPKKYHAAIFKDGKIYWAGGITHTSPAVGNEDSITCQVEIKEVNTQVSSFANLSEPTLYNEAFEKDNKIIIISPHSGWGAWQQFDVYDLASGSWSIGQLAQSNSSYASIISANNSIYIAGGISSSAGNIEYLTQVWKLEF